MAAEEREAAKLTDERKKALNLAIAQIEKNCGKGAIMRMGSDSPRVRVDAISTGAKRREIVRAARAWIDRYGQPSDIYRFDCIGIMQGKLEHLEDAFRPGWR